MSICYLCRMKIIRVNMEDFTVDLYRTKQDAAIDAGMSRFRFSRMLDRHGEINVNQYKYTYPNEKS